jgi:hypothetical protein
MSEMPTVAEDYFSTKTRANRILSIEQIIKFQTIPSLAVSFIPSKTYAVKEKQANIFLSP